MADVPVLYVNSTGKTDFDVVVFTQNYHPDAPPSPYIAWQVLKGDTKSQSFKYPANLQVGAIYRDGRRILEEASFDKWMWSLSQDTSDSTPVLTEGKSVAPLAHYVLYS